MKLRKVSAVLMSMSMVGAMAVPTFADEAKTIEPCEITFWHAMNGKQEESLTALTDKFNEENEYGITVTLVNQGNYSDLSTKLTANAAADTLPDLSQGYNNWVTAYTDKIIPLDDFVTDEDFDYDDLIDSYKDECEVYGFVACVPFNKSTYVYFYNKTLFDEVGIDVPTTWDEFLNVCEVFKEAGNVQTVRQGVVDIEGHGDLDAAILIPVLAPGDPGMAVPRHAAWELDLHVGEPGDAGDEEVVQDVAVLRQDALLDGGGLVGLALGAERAEIGNAAVHVHVHVDVGAIRFDGGVGGLAEVILHHRAIRQETAAQLRHGVARPGNGEEEAQKEGQASRPDGGQEVRDVHHHGGARPGVRHGGEVGELPGTGTLGHIDDLSCHGGLPFPTKNAPPPLIGAKHGFTVPP